MSHHQHRERLRDSQYDNALLVQIASESPTFRRLVEQGLSEFRQDKQQGSVIAIARDTQWLGSLIDDMQEHTQVQLVITQQRDDIIDED